MMNGEELEFRDGTYVVPDHVAALMAELDTTKWTYRAALDLVNTGLLSQFLGKVQSDTVKHHFEQVRSDGHPR